MKTKILTNDGLSVYDGEIKKYISGQGIGTRVEASSTNGNIKVNNTDITVYTHPSGTNPHGTTKSDIGLGNVPNVATNDQTPSYTEATTLAKLISGEKLSVAFGKISKAITDLISHIGDSVKHITSTERNNWNSAKTHADSSHAPSNAQANQNAFSNIMVGSTNVSADTETDTLTLVAGTNITLTPDVTNDKITISSTDTNTWRPLGTTADTACAGNDSRLSNARPASDVYSWAKASSKPSYSWSEINDKPSTFTPSSHTHDDRYYTESEVDNLLSKKSNTGHTHYYQNLNIRPNFVLRHAGFFNSSGEMELSNSNYSEFIINIYINNNIWYGLTFNFAKKQLEYMLVGDQGNYSIFNRTIYDGSYYSVQLGAKYSGDTLYLKIFDVWQNGSSIYSSVSNFSAYIYAIAF